VKRREGDRCFLRLRGQRLISCLNRSPRLRGWLARARCVGGRPRDPVARDAPVCVLRACAGPESPPICHRRDRRRMRGKSYASSSADRRGCPMIGKPGPTIPSTQTPTNCRPARQSCARSVESPQDLLCPTVVIRSRKRKACKAILSWAEGAVNAQGGGAPPGISRHLGLPISRQKPPGGLSKPISARSRSGERRQGRCQIPPAGGSLRVSGGEISPSKNGPHMDVLLDWPKNARLAPDTYRNLHHFNTAAPAAVALPEGGGHAQEASRAQYGMSRSSRAHTCARARYEGLCGPSLGFCRGPVRSGTIPALRFPGEGSAVHYGPSKRFANDPRILATYCATQTYAPLSLRGGGDLKRQPAWRDREAACPILVTKGRLVSGVALSGSGT